jgi:hypothetical protein
MRSRIFRIFTGLILAVAILVVGAILRINTTLPLLDRMRFDHWMWSDEWDELADALWQEPQIDEIYCLFEDDDCEIEAKQWASDGDQLIWPMQDVALSEARRSEFYELMHDAHIYSLNRADSQIYLELRSGIRDRFERTIFAYLVSPRAGYEHAVACENQYRIDEQGVCEVSLGPTWVVRYSWTLTAERQWAKCVGVWREYGPPPETIGGFGFRQVGTDEELGWAIEELGEEEAMELLERGRQELRSARSDSATASVDELLARCTI